jgi:membrane protease YdiL (CAAX protease family)
MSKKLLLLAEFLGIFVFAPLLFYFELLPVPKLAFLVVVAGIILYLLIKDRVFNKSDLWKSGSLKPFLKTLVFRFLMVAGFLTVITFLFFPGSLFDLPREKPGFWLALMVFYPLFSAFPQELIYRGYFFFRYKTLFPSKTLLITASVLSFAFLHIIYYNMIAVLLTLFGGYLFTHTYTRTNSLILAGAEHSLYGCLVFTIGLGKFFY